MLSNEFEVIIERAYWPQIMSQTVLIVADTGEEIEVKFERNEAVFGNIRKAIGDLDHDDVRLVVKGKKATLFLENNLFATIFVKPDVIYSTMIVKGLKDKDRIFGLSVRNF